MDQSQYIFIDTSAVQYLITERQKGDSYRIDELIIAVFLCKFCERIWKTSCAIGFPLKHSEVKSVPTAGSSGLVELKDILNKKTEQMHDVDVLIVKHTPNNPKRSGQGFQIKRFNTYQKDLTTEGVIGYIKSLKYAKTDTALVILLETGESTKFTQIRDSINFIDFPFSGLYLIALHGDTLKLIEVWPSLGKKELNWKSV